jgi:hypothetical protein
MRPLLLLVAATAAVVAASACPYLDNTRPRGLPPASAGTDPVILAAGDIAACTSSGDEATANLLDTLAGTVLTLGDNAYESGTPLEFTTCYAPTWGRHKARTMPSPGNHDYNTPGATGYYTYFGAAAGDPSKGYYSFDVGTWHLIALNSNCGAIGGCGAASPMVTWLRNDLAANPTQCTLAYWHHARFSSSAVHGSSTTYQAMWQALYDYGADVVLVGHDHNYERFAPQTATGVADPSYGIREFVVGTGGKSHYGFDPVPQPNSEVRDSTSYGVLSMTLHANSYDFSFVPAAGYSFTDSGSGTCHGAQLDPDDDGLLDADDNCPSAWNPGQENADANFVSHAPVYGTNDLTWINSDNIGDACDDDDDNDGLIDPQEVGGAPCPSPTATFTPSPTNTSTITPTPTWTSTPTDTPTANPCTNAPCASATGPTDPLLRDTDGDLYLDGPECARGTNPNSAASRPSPGACGGLTADTDGDRVKNHLENCAYGSSPALVDSDGDATTTGASDGCEVASLNADRVVNAGDQLLLAQELVRIPPPAKLSNIDLNKDGTISSGDQLIMVLFISPPGQCP